MKKLIFILFLFQCLSMISQEINVNYKFIGPVYNSDGTIQFKPNHKVKVVKVDSNSVKFIYYKFNGKDTIITKKLNNKYYHVTVNDSLDLGYKTKGNSNEVYNTNLELLEIKVHELSIDEFNNYTIRYDYYKTFKGVRAGFFTVPFKLRLSDFDFEQNVNLGMNIGFQFRANRKVENGLLFEPTLGIGLATVSLNPENSNLTGEDNRTASAFSISAGLIISFTENINLGIQYGWDHLGNNDKEVNWIFDRKPWLGIGINIGFSVKESKEKEPENELSK